MYKKKIYKGKQVHFRDEGQGNCLVLLHGFLESLEIWDDFVVELQKDFRVVCIDLPGHGKSDCIAETHSMQLMADAVNDVLKYLSINQCLMIGHSMGGYVTLEFARNYPHKLSGFGLFHSNAGADDEEARKNRDRTIEIVRNDKTAFISNFIPDLFASENIIRFEKEIDKLKISAILTPKDGIVAALKGMKERTSKLELLKEIPVPVLFIAGKKDKRIPLDIIKEQFILPGHAEILILNKAGHMGFIEAKDETLDTVKYFLYKISFRDK